MFEEYEDYESIEDIARGEGFFIDDDGHWQPMEDVPDYFDFYLEDVYEF